MKKIQWNKVTWYSKFLAVVLFFIVFAWAFHLGRQYEQIYEMQNIANSKNAQVSISAAPSVSSAAVSSISESLINNVAFTCDASKTIQAQFMQNNLGQGSVALELSDGRNLTLPQAMSADGARYAKPDESFVFWDKGNGSFIEEGAPYATSGQKMTYTSCVAAQ